MSPLVQLAVEAVAAIIDALRRSGEDISAADLASKAEAHIEANRRALARAEAAEDGKFSG